MIEAVNFTNFKALRQVGIDLQRLTVLVGPNASGKTSILQGLQLLSDLRDADPLQVFVGERNPATLVSSGETHMDLAAHGGDPNWTLQVEGHPGKRGKDPWEFCITRKYGGHEEVYRTTDTRRFDQWSMGNTEPLDRAFPAAAILHLDARSLAKSTRMQSQPRMSSNGEGLGDLLGYLKQRHEDRFHAIESALRSVVPNVKKIRLDRVDVIHHDPEPDAKGQMRLVERKSPGQLLLFDMVGGASIPAYAISEGTLLTLGLLTVLSEPEQPRLLLIDDIEHGLHPKAHAPLIEQLQKLLEQDVRLQIVATTHSPYLLDQLAYEQVLLVTLKEDGSTVCAPLAEHPDLPKWKENMDPGEFWSMTAEEWIKSRAGQ